MLKKTAFALAVLPAIYAGAAQASSVDPAIVAANRALSVSLGAVNQNYRELKGNGSVFDKENGTIPRIGVEYSLMGQEKPLLFYIGMDYAKGDTSYKGAVQNLLTGVSTPYDSSTGNEMLDLRVGLGYAFGFGRFAFIPGFEYGFSSWQRHLNHGNPPGYDESYAHGHVAGTLSAQVALGKTVLRADVAYGQTLAPRMDTGGTLYVLGTKPWSRIGLGVDYAVKASLHAGARVAYTQFKYGASPVNAAGFYEPNSKTQHTTFDFVVSYNF